MGTRNLTVVISDNVHKIAQYGQYDGYPDGQGLTVLNFCKKHLSDNKGIKKFIKQANKVQLVTDEDIARFKKESSNFKHEYPSLCRDFAASILELVLTEDEVLVYDAINFSGDSLFCEWLYLIDLDKKRFEVYKGFNKEPLFKNERFYSYRDEKDEYYPVRLKTWYNLSDLPTKKEFIKELCVDEDE